MVPQHISAMTAATLRHAAFISCGGDQMHQISSTPRRKLLRWQLIGAATIIWSASPPEQSTKLR